MAEVRALGRSSLGLENDVSVGLCHGGFKVPAIDGIADAPKGIAFSCDIAYRTATFSSVSGSCRTTD